MPYCTIDDIRGHIDEEELVALIYDDRTGAANTAFVDEAIRTAEALIDSKLRGFYVVPLDPCDDIVRAIAIALAIAELFGRKKGILVPDPIQKTRDAQMALLTEITEGKRSLSSPTAAAPPAAVQVEARPAVFSREVLDRY